MRTGDTPDSARARQTQRLPTALVTTPESLSLFLSRADWRERFAHVEAVIVDEWHELLASKRGVQVQLALARLFGLRPALRVWGLSATLANLSEALAALVGLHRGERRALVLTPRQAGRARLTPRRHGRRRRGRGAWCGGGR